MTTIAPILEQTVGKIRFCVDNIKTNENRLPIENAKSQLEQSLKKQLLAFSHDETFSLINNHGIHPLVQAVHAAFSQHRPLLLTPDIIWLTLAQGFAQHINNNAEALRSQFVKHQGKQTLIVERDGIPSQPQEWDEAVQEWGLQIRDRVGADLYRLMECNFSTTTPVTRTASYIVMMEAFQQYFDYVMMCICGIPNITLLGTVEDWQSIYDRVQSMAQYDLTWWTNRLLPICKEFVETAAGRPSLSFWCSIYKPKAIYGAELITGWLADLFPYVKHNVTKAYSVRNPVLGMNRFPLEINYETRSFDLVDYGISPDSLPLGISEVNVKLQHHEKDYTLKLIAGFIGFCQDANEGILQPEIGWGVLEASDRFVELLDKIQQQHLAQPPINWDKFELGFFDSFPKEHIQLLDRFDGATLYPNSGHSWRISKSGSDKNSCFKSYSIPELKISALSNCHFLELEDGRCIAYKYNFRSQKCWMILGKPVIPQNTAPNGSFESFLYTNSAFQLKEVVVIAESITELLERIFEAEGHYYFDDPNFVPNSNYPQTL